MGKHIFSAAVLLVLAGLIAFIIIGGTNVPST